MAFLMLLHEKMRLQRKVNKLTLKQAQASSRKEKVTNQIERQQKLYSKKEANLEAFAKRMQNVADMQFRNIFGVASNNINMNPLAYVNGGLNNSGVLNVIQQAIQSGQIEFGTDQNPIEDADELMAILQGKYRKATNMEGREVWVTADDTPDENGQFNISYEDQENLRKKLQAAQYIQNNASMNYTQNQNLCTNAITNYQNNVSIWLEAEKARLETEQDEVLAPLQEQETEWDMESQSAEVQLQDASARLDSIKQALSEGIKDSAPTFGLG